MPEEYKLDTRLVRDKQGLGVDRVDTSSLRSETVEQPRATAAGYMSDGFGHVRLMTVAQSNNNGMLTGQIDYLFRPANSSEWKPLTTVADAGNPDFEPLAIDGTIDSLYALRKKDGRYALYSIRLDDSHEATLVAENPRVDIDDVIRLGDGQRVIGYTYTEDATERVYFDPEFKALGASLSRALPNSPIIEFVDASSDGHKLLIFAGSDQDPGRYYTFDRVHKSLTPAMIGRPELEGRLSPRLDRCRFPVREEFSIPAYLTLPPGKAAKNLPAIVLPHGGPSARDVWGFDWLPQFLAARGYAVLQPEYRGSAGLATRGSTKTGSRAGGRRSATSRIRRNGSKARASPIPTGWRSSAGRTADMRRCSRRRSNRRFTRRWWRSRR